MASFEFSYDWRAAEHTQVVAFLTREAWGRGVWRIVAWAYVLFVLVAIAITGFLAVSGHGKDALELVPWVLYLLLFFWYMRTGMAKFSAWQARRHDRNVGHPVTVRLSESGLEIRTHTATVDLTWAGLYKVRERPDHFLFYYNRRCAYRLPVRVIPPDQLPALRAFIRQHLAAETPYLAPALAI